MAMVADDIIQLTVKGTLFTEQVTNVYYYVCVDNVGEAGLGQVSESFRLNVIDALVELQSEDFNTYEIASENLTNELDFHVSPIDKDGLTLSPSCSSAVAGAVTLLVGTRLTRPGSKRIAGIPEVYVASNIWSPIPADMTAFLIAVGDPLDLSELVTPYDCTMEPIVVGRFPIEHEDAGKLDLSRTQIIYGGAYREDITTQTSRRPGRGS